jgi:hypothetical protein
MKRSTTLVLASAVSGAALAAGACFPNIAIVGENSSSSSSGGAGGSSTAAGGGTGGRAGSSSTATSSASSSTGTIVASSSTTASSSSGSSGSSGSSSSNSSSSGSSSSGSSSGDAGCTIDDDHDLVLSWKCNMADLNDRTKDCGDEDPQAYPNAAAFHASPINGARNPNTSQYDFNCDGLEEQETTTLNCSGLTCTDTTTVGFGTVVACGMTGQLGKCAAVAVLGCTFQPGSTMTTQRCK